MHKTWIIIIKLLHYVWIALLIYLGIEFIYKLILVSKKIEITYINYWIFIGILVLNIPYLYYKYKLKKEKKGE